MFDVSVCTKGEFLEFYKDNLINTNHLPCIVVSAEEIIFNTFSSSVIALILAKKKRKIKERYSLSHIPEIYFVFCYILYSKNPQTKLLMSNYIA